MERGLTALGTDSLESAVTTVETLLRDPLLHVELRGFTDSRECVSIECDQLALRRADTVGNWLVAHGVHPDRMRVSRGVDAEIQAGPNDTEAGRAAGRRVDIVVVDVAGDTSIR